MNEEFDLEKGDLAKLEYLSNCKAISERYMDMLCDPNIVNNLSDKKLRKFVDNTLDVYANWIFLNEDTYAYIRNRYNIENFKFDFDRHKIIDLGGNK